jgi:sRNA-binding carbon storage regulator CsrA
MALNLAVREGESVYIDGRPITVLKVRFRNKKHPEDGFLVKARKPDGTEFELYEEKAVEVFPTVFVQLGFKTQYGQASLTIDAPSNVLILTEKNYHAVHTES